MKIPLYKPWQGDPRWDLRAHYKISTVIIYALYVSVFVQVHCMKMQIERNGKCALEERKEYERERAEYQGQHILLWCRKWNLNVLYRDRDKQHIHIWYHTYNSHFYTIIHTTIQSNPPTGKKIAIWGNKMPYLSKTATKQQKHDTQLKNHLKAFDFLTPFFFP